MSKNATVSVRCWEVDGKEVPVDKSAWLIVESHRRQGEKVNLSIEGKRVVVDRGDLVEAIAACGYF